jgi:lysyl-tRNA synthetase class I
MKVLEISKVIEISKERRFSIAHVVILLQIVDEDNNIVLTSLEKGRDRHLSEIHEFDTQIERYKNYLHSLSIDIAKAKKLK